MWIESKVKWLYVRYFFHNPKQAFFTSQFTENLGFVLKHKELSASIVLTADQDSNMYLDNCILKSLGSNLINTHREQANFFFMSLLFYLQESSWIEILLVFELFCVFE